MSKHQKHKEKAEKVSMDSMNLNDLNDYIKNIDLSQVNSMLEQIDLSKIDMNEMNSLISNLGLDNISEEQIKDLTSNLGDLSKIDLNSLYNKDDMSDALNDLVKSMEESDAFQQLAQQYMPEKKDKE